MDTESENVRTFVADTHALFWYLTASPRLGTKAKEVFDASARGEAIIYVPAIVLAELYFLNEKAGRPLDFTREFQVLPESGQFAFIPFVANDVSDFEQDAATSEMHDRMIVGVARRMDATCISIDTEIVNSGFVKTVW